MKLIYFTSTGNNIYICQSLGGELLSIPQLMKDSINLIEDDSVGIIFPVYYYSIPQIVRDFITNVEIKCNYLFTIASYGSAEFGALRALKICNKLLSKSGLNVNYSNCVLMVDNFLPMFDISQELKNKNQTDIDRQINLIKNDVENKKQLPLPNNLLGDLIFTDYILKTPMTTIFKLKITDKECSQCMICTKVCPRGNITVDDKPIIGNNCELCLACVHHCKKQVIKTNHEKSSKRFINQNVKLSQIIKSNNLNL